MMKLSAAIELALLNKRYHPLDPYMCNAMYAMGYWRHIDAIESMLDTISPDNYTLFGAVGDVLPRFLEMSREEKFAYTSQLYCWWVFDLKREGL